MPSSMCWPFGDMPQRCAEASLASRNTSLRVCRSKMPRRFTQGPRLVETVTSGLVVTMCGGQLLAARPGRGRSRRGCRRTPPGWTSCRPAFSGIGSAAGTAIDRRGQRAALGASAARRTGRRRRKRLQLLGRASSPSNRSHSWPARMPISARNASICSLVIRPAWLSLWPANGRPMPLIV